jgi:hypothetical protein
MTDQETEYQRQIIDTLVLAKYARTEEERAQHFRAAEQWSARAREAERRARAESLIN